MENQDKTSPMFDFPIPPGYRWMLEKGLISFGSSPLYPWHFLDRMNSFTVDEKWPHKSGTSDRLVAFARRYDNDDIACFTRIGEVTKVTVIHGWTPSGYDVISTYDSFWDWVRSVIDDIAELAGG